jgi:hypothetical protein
VTKRRTNVSDTMKVARRVVAIVGVFTACGAATCLLTGCGKGEDAGHNATFAKASAPRGPASREQTVTEADIPLPAWVPEEPSPEYVRAARVLKPMPVDGFGDGDHLARAAEYETLHREIIPRVWEFFGSLSDEQIDGFRIEGDIIISVREMSPAQRAAMDRIIQSFERCIWQGRDSDLQVSLYKMGAREDFTNVDFGFGHTSRDRGSRAVLFLYCIRLADGRSIGSAIGPIAHL